MDVGKIIPIAREAMAGRKAHPVRERGFILHHGMRVGRLAVNLLDVIHGLDGCGMKPAGELRAGATGNPSGYSDRDILFIGGLFHDVGKGFGSHADMGAQLVRCLLKDVCAPDEIEQVAFLVRNHNRRDGSLPLPARTLQDADVLDHVGAQMVWIAFQYSANTESAPEDCVRYYFSEEHVKYLKELRDSLNFDQSREAFDLRRVEEIRFFERFRAELDGAF
ncbi:MAG TPA: HD domain-containing protein [Candidatus Brocadiia bacterium]|nr:HD domain-containing protein [Candidatus Brocadiia bacterium]